MNPLLLLVIKDVVVPEVANYISQHFAATGKIPTQEELQAQIDNLSAAITMKADNFIAQVLKDHPELGGN